jgi:hypothetical protein
MEEVAVARGCGVTTPAVRARPFVLVSGLGLHLTDVLRESPDLLVDVLCLARHADRSRTQHAGRLGGAVADALDLGNGAIDVDDVGGGRAEIAGDFLRRLRLLLDRRRDAHRETFQLPNCRGHPLNGGVRAVRHILDRFDVLIDIARCIGGLPR